jgi:hypothetical protein
MILYEVQPGPYFRRCRITPTHPHTSFARPPCTRITSVPSLPLHCSVTYKASPFQGHGTICNLSMNDWRLSGDLPAQTAGTLSLRVRFPNEQCIEFPQAVIRWARGQEFAGPATVPFSRRPRRGARTNENWPSCTMWGKVCRRIFVQAYVWYNSLAVTQGDKPAPQLRDLLAKQMTLDPSPRHRSEHGSGSRKRNKHRPVHTREHGSRTK